MSKQTLQLSLSELVVLNEIWLSLVCNKPLNKASSAAQVNKTLIVIKTNQKSGALGLKLTSPNIIAAVNVNEAKAVVIIIKVACLTGPLLKLFYSNKSKHKEITPP